MKNVNLLGIRNRLPLTGDASVHDISNIDIRRPAVTPGSPPPFWIETPRPSHRAAVTGDAKTAPRRFCDRSSPWSSPSCHRFCRRTERLLSARQREYACARPMAAIAAKRVSAAKAQTAAIGRKLSPADPAHRGFITNSPFATGASSARLSTASPVAPNHIKPLSTSKRHLHPHGDIAPH